MTLAVMLSTDKDAFICDMAETYNILDIWALPVKVLAVLASGLREDSRIKMIMAGLEYVPLEMLAAHCADSLALILYVLSADKNTERPRRLIDLIMGQKEEPKKKTGFATFEEFEAARMKILSGVNNHG